LINTIHTTQRLSLKALFSATLILNLASCGFQDYIAKPINTAAISEKIASRRIDDQRFHEYLIANGYQAEQLPIQQWSGDDLVLFALFYNPSLDVARAQWRSAEAAKLTAGERRLPNLNTKFGKSNNANEEISPYTYTLSIDLPIETANKRNIRIENAAHLSEAAKLRIAQSAWQLRFEVAKTFYEYQYNQQLVQLLTQEQAYRQQISAIFQKRISVGESASTELSRANLILQEITTQLNEKQRYQLVLQARLASSLGLTLDKVAQMQLAKALDAKTHRINLDEDLQSQALLNRLDIRIALERYAAAEARVKLEIARQYPDVILTPNYTYEFGNKIWALGLSGLMTIITKNKMLIAEAKQLREVEAAQFEALQNTVIAEVNTGKAKLEQSKQMLENQALLMTQQQDNTNRVESKLRAGEADRLEFTYAKLEALVAEKNYALANFFVTNSITELENIIQAPLLASRIKSDQLEQLSSSNIRE
jgi:cobalt-zinc-cadmium efflux system outer membrane protein